MKPRQLGIDFHIAEGVSPEERMYLGVIRQTVTDYLYPESIVGHEHESIQRMQARAGNWIFLECEKAKRLSLRWILEVLYPDDDTEHLLSLIRSRVRKYEQHSKCDSLTHKLAA